MSDVIESSSRAMALPENELLQVLQSSLYPGAAPNSIKMVIGYCKAAGLDPMQKPVHIVPMWDAKAGQMRDVIMPGVNLYRTQAARSGQFAGMSEPEFGPDFTDKIGGQEITYPEWCRVTVRRLLSGGVVAEFTAREFWIENYAIKGGKEKSIAPNAMWTKRPRGQIAKCASAQALRIAFPEIASQPTAEEMEGKAVHADEAAPATPPAVPPDVLAAGRAAAALGMAELSKWYGGIGSALRDLCKPYNRELKTAAAQADADRAVEDPFVAEMEAAEAATEEAPQ